MSEFQGKVSCLGTVPDRAPMMQLLLLLLLLHFRELCCPGESKAGKKNSGGKIPRVGHRKVERKLWGGTEKGSSVALGCPWSLPSRLLPGPEFLSTVSVSVSDFGERNLAQGKSGTGIHVIISSFLSSLGCSCSCGISSPIPLQSLHLAFSSLSAPQALGSHHPAAEEPLSLRMLQISSFANNSQVHTQGPGWVGELQTHYWDGIM